MFYKCLNKSVNEAIEVVKKISDNTKFQEYKFELFYKVVIAVHFIADYEERVRLLIPKTDKDFTKGFLYLNNQLKHDYNLEMFYYEVCGSMFPMRFPMRFGKPGIYWDDFVDNGKKTSRGQRKHYEENLMNKDIEETLLKALNIFSDINNSSNLTTKQVTL